MLKITALEKTFSNGTPNRHTALFGLNLTLQDSDFVTILGSNVLGKSTLFNAIAGTFFCDRGRIELDGRDITFLPKHKRARMISRIFQDPMKGPAPALTIEETLALAYARGAGRHLFSTSLTKKDRGRFRELLASLEMGLEDRMTTPIGLLSGGQRQAVTLLMCTVVPPRLLLLDEHTAALDPVTAEKVLSLTRQIVQRDSITTMMITHNLASALAVGNRTIILNHGSVVMDLDAETRVGLDEMGLLSLYRSACGSGSIGNRTLLTEANESSPAVGFGR